MAGSVNKVIIIGTLGRDPESRSFSNGGKIVSFSLATSESWKDKNSGERKERTEWHNVVVQNENIASFVERYCKKGSNVYVDGQIQSREYTDKEGNQRRITEIVVGRFKGEVIFIDGRYNTAAWQPGAQAPRRRDDPPAGSLRLTDIIDDDVPF